MYSKYAGAHSMNIWSSVRLIVFTTNLSSAVFAKVAPLFPPLAFQAKELASDLTKDSSSFKWANSSSDVSTSLSFESLTVFEAEVAELRGIFLSTRKADRTA